MAESWNRSWAISRRLALISGVMLMTGALQAVDIEEQDIQSLRDWINTKRMITVRELGGQLSISGDVHAEMQATSLVKNGNAQRGRGTDKPNNQYDVEFNLMVDYRTDRSWLSSRLRFDNDAGLLNDNFGSGKSDKIKLERAYWGYRLLDGDRHTMDIDIGRRGPMVGVFDSKLQFVSIFDGIALKDSYAVDNVGDLYYQLGAFVINEKKDQAAYIGEMGILNIANTGFYSKYALIDWDTKNTHDVPVQFHFIISQLILGYKWIPQVLDRPVVIYLGSLYNHRARPVKFSSGKKANYAGYLGFNIGALKLAGDWAFDANYQILAAQCIPDFDVSGIGMGSKSEEGFYVHNGKAIKKRDQAEGNVNYRGFELTLQYLISNNLNLWQQWKQSITLDNAIGPHRRFKQYEVDFIYSF
ncbi:MAG: hypothetical protein ACRDFB_09200 [Rhabdochlamydiaceae bacterium]